MTTTTPLTLTLEAVKTAARDFYERGILTAQHPDPRSRQCAYWMPGGYRCAIGAAMPEAFLTQYAPAGDVFAVERAHLITSPNMEDLYEIQMAHDCWVSEAQAPRSPEGSYGSPESILKARDNFLRMIDVVPPAREDV